MSARKSPSSEEFRLLLANFCVYRDRSHSEVDQKMWDLKIPLHLRDDLWLYLLENDFLNEQRFANAFALGKFHQKSWGKVKIYHALRAKGVPTHLIEEALSKIEDQEYFECMERLIIKRNGSVPEDFLERQKLIRYLLAKGFAYDSILPLVS